MFETIDHHFNVAHRRCRRDFISTCAFIHICCRQKFPKVDKWLPVLIPTECMKSEWKATNVPLMAADRTACEGTDKNRPLRCLNDRVKLYPSSFPGSWACPGWELWPLVLLSDDLPKPKGTELLQKGVETVQEYSPDEEREESRRWRVFRIGEQEHRVDMKAIEPYKRVISHGGNIPAGERASSVSILHERPTRSRIGEKLTKESVGFRPVRLFSLSTSNNNGAL